MTPAQRQALKRAVDARRRALEEVKTRPSWECPNGWGSLTGYSHFGCRCDACRLAANEARCISRRNQKGRKAA